jgi:uncharacterized protein
MRPDTSTSLPPARLYRGRTVHVRFAPFAHRLDYRVYQVLLDIDRLEEADRLTGWFGVERACPLSFRRADHGPRDGSALRPWAVARFAEAGIALDGGRIALLCFPRVLGFVFNPLSVWFGHRPDGSLAGVIYEVNNTFGETHAYVAPVATTDDGPVRQEADKAFHVSPFFDVTGRYAFTLRPPGETLSLVIETRHEDGRSHIATLKARERAFVDAELARAFFAVPLMTLQVVAGIHLEAAKLWLKGARYRPKPPPPVPVSIAHALNKQARNTQALNTQALNKQAHQS